MRSVETLVKQTRGKARGRGHGIGAYVGRSGQTRANCGCSKGKRGRFDIFFGRGEDVVLKKGSIAWVRDVGPTGLFVAVPRGPRNLPFL